MFLQDAQIGSSPLSVLTAESAPELKVHADDKIFTSTNVALVVSWQYDQFRAYSAITNQRRSPDSSYVVNESDPVGAQGDVVFLALRESQTLHGFSAITGNWHSPPPNPSASSDIFVVGSNSC